MEKMNIWNASPGISAHLSLVFIPIPKIDSGSGLAIDHLLMNPQNPLAALRQPFWPPLTLLVVSPMLSRADSVEIMINGLNAREGRKDSLIATINSGNDHVLKRMTPIKSDYSGRPKSRESHERKVTTGRYLTAAAAITSPQGGLVESGEFPAVAFTSWSGSMLAARP